MPIRYARSDKLKLAVLVVSGRLNPADIVPYSEQHRAAGGFSDGVLCDLRTMTGPPLTPATMRALAGMLGRRQDDRPRIAILASDPGVYAPIGAYDELGGSHPTIKVFEDQAAAEDWLCADEHDGIC